EQLNPIEAPMVFYCQPAMDALPEPEAVMLTNIAPQKAAQQGLPENQFFQRVHQALAMPNSCSVGYNNLRFDDEVTRFGFYRNFLDPYAHAWQNGNSRWDILDLVRLCYALRPEGIQWAFHTEGEHQGKASFRLQDLTAANGIAHRNAHDALGDVEATIALARLIKQKQPRLFDYYLKFRHKHQAAQCLNVAAASIILHVSGMFPAEEGCLAPIVPLLVHPQNRNEIICYNLRYAPDDLQRLDAEQIRTRLYTRNEDLAEGQQRIPLKGVHLNKSPALAPPKTLSADLAKKWQIDWGIIEQHYQQLMTIEGLQDKLLQVYQTDPQNPHETKPMLDADLALYEGFIPNEDREQCQLLQQTHPEQLAQWSPDVFRDKRLQTLLFRYRARNYPQTLTAEEQRRWQQFCQARLHEGAYGATRTWEQVQQSLTQLAQQPLNDTQAQLLRQLSTWLSH
ncbi:MAG TPA: exodeoxyribonuclease I, partial [Thiothrix sp.]|nr:exodeoxyribonuclease I [Thiothrix sp.]